MNFLRIPRALSILNDTKLFCLTVLCEHDSSPTAEDLFHVEDSGNVLKAIMIQHKFKNPKFKKGCCLNTLIMFFSSYVFLFTKWSPLCHYAYFLSFNYSLLFPFSSFLSHD